MNRINNTGIRNPKPSALNPTPKTLNPRVTPTFGNAPEFGADDRAVCCFRGLARASVPTATPEHDGCPNGFELTAPPCKIVLVWYVVVVCAVLAYVESRYA